MENLPTVAKFKPLLIIISFFLLLLCLGGLSTAFSAERNVRFDFRTQYVAGYMVRAGFAHELYDYESTRRFQNELVSESEKALPFIHLSYEALLYVPFSFLRYESAYFLFFAVNLTLLALSFAALKHYMFSLNEAWNYLPLIIFVCFLPVTMTLLEGQNSIFLLLLMILVFKEIEREREFSAGLLLGLASIKFQYVIPIGLLFVAWRRWRFLGGLAFSCSLVLGVSIWLTGVAGFEAYLSLLGNMSAHFSSENGMRLGIRPELMPNLRGLITVIMSGPPSNRANVFTVIASAVTLIVAATKKRSFPLALLAALLVSYHETFTDATLLILPIALAASVAAREPAERNKYLLWSCSTVIVAPAPLLLFGVRFYLLCLPILTVMFLWDGVVVAGRQTSNAPQLGGRTGAVSG
jgi:hypothetical protein